MCFCTYLDLNLYSVAQWGLGLMLYPGYDLSFHFIAFDRFVFSN